ncbi:histone-lysine N-methyltransferase SETMAR-like [Dermacentor silvarum]|uniref:histone-lysine N-methyltransferase SETMAR-like n=1 Tax=Dermacentor silvarum TaxID=543639 RepID=UPI002100E524|nr:histone-lysine N-methyltransferase SETMAR-like [Dermacentor silvarum]
MEKGEFRAVIKHFYLKHWTAAQIKAKLSEVHGDSAPSLKTIYYWINEFKRGRTSTQDEARPGRPVEVTTPEMVLKIHGIVMEDRRVKVREIADIVGISAERIHNILHEKLQMKKVCARWVPRLLTIDQRRMRADISNQCLSMLDRNRQDFWRRFVTVDETWIHHYTPESKQKSKQWTGPDEGAPKKAKTVCSAGKMMATVFWDLRGIIFVDYLQNSKTITGPYYATLLDQLKKELRTKRPGLARKKLLFYQDNAPPHRSLVAMAKLHELGFNVVPHLPYSPDLAPHVTSSSFQT